jgi:preprotein translocase subunit SecE
MEKTINKIMMVSFVCGAFLVGYTVQVLNTLLASSWGAYARLTDSEIVSNLLPIAAGLLFFIYLVSSKKVRQWSQEVIVEISKVVWPSKKETTALTVFVCIFMIFTGILLGIFDYFSSQVIQAIIEMS